jgi:hypothetical protein
MKQFLIITICMLLTSVAYAVTDDFESYSVGGTATKWIYEADTNPGLALVSDAQSVSGDQSLHFSCAGDGAREVTWLLANQPIVDGSIAFSVYFDINVETAQQLFIRQTAVDDADVKYIMAEWRIKRNTGIQEIVSATGWINGGGEISANEWHTFQVNFDHTTQTWDLIFDSELIADNFGYGRGNATCETINMGLGDFKTLALYNLDAYIDDVKLLSETAASTVTDIIGVDLTPHGLELLYTVNTDEDTTHDIVYKDSLVDSWQTATTYTVGESSGIHPFTTENFGSRLFSAADGQNGKVYGSSYQKAQFYEFDLTTRESTVRGVPFVLGAQIYSVLPYSPTKIYFGSYTKSDFIVLDPTQPWVTNGEKAAYTGTNPTYLGPLGDEQNRPIDIMLGPDGYIYVANFPDYGKVGGALTKLDPATDTWVNYRNIVDTQSLVSLCSIAGNDHLIAGGTSAKAQGYPEPLAPAKLYLWDTNLDTVVYQVKPPVGADMYEVPQLESTDDGIVIGLCNKEPNQNLYLFVFDPVTRTFLHTQDITSTVGEGYIIGNLSKPYNGYMYFTAHNGNICAINTTTYAVSVTNYPGVTKGGEIVQDPLNGNKMTYLVMANTELLGMSLDPPMYEFVNYGTMVGQPYEAEIVYGPNPEGIVDTAYMVFNNWYQNWFLVALNTTTGEYAQYMAPDGNQSKYGQCIGFDGKLYVSTAKEGNLYVFDPKNPDSGVQDLGVVCPGEPYLFDLCIGPDGRLYMGSYPNGKLLSYNIDSGTFIDYGRVSNDEMYVRYVAPCNDRYAYARVGPVNRRLFRVDLLTHEKEQVPLPPEFDNFSLYLGTDGNVYCTQDATYLRVDGLATTVVSSKPNKFGVINIPGIDLSYNWVSQEVTYNRFYGTSILWIDSGDTQTARTDPRNESKRFYRIKQ